MTHFNLASPAPICRRPRITVEEWEQICANFVVAFNSPKYLVSLL